jgi:anti-sigma factor RsiW
VSGSCDRARASLSGYGLEALSAEDRRAVREHLRGCPECRAAAAEEDPVLLFSAMPEPRVDATEIASVVSSVRAAIAWKEAERRVVSSRPVGRSRRRRVRVAAAAAVFLLTLAVPSGLRTPAPERDGAAGTPPGDASAVAAPAGAAKASGGATVYDWNPGAGEPRVVWIVDGSLDI